MALKKTEIDKLVSWAMRKGYSVRQHNHPKTKANWNKGGKQ